MRNERFNNELFARQKKHRENITPKYPSARWESMMDELGSIPKTDVKPAPTTIWEDPFLNRPDPRPTKLKFMPRSEYDYSDVPTGDEALRIAGRRKNTLTSRIQRRAKGIGRAAMAFLSPRERYEVVPPHSSPDISAQEPTATVDETIETTTFIETLDSDFLAVDTDSTKDIAAIASAPIELVAAVERGNTPAERLPAESPIQTVKYTNNRRERSWFSRRKLAALALAGSVFTTGLAGSSASQNTSARTAPTTATAAANGADHAKGWWGIDSSLSLDTNPQSSVEQPQTQTQVEAPQVQAATPELAPAVEVATLKMPEFSPEGRLTEQGAKDIKDFFSGYTIKSGDTMWGLAQQYLEAKGEDVTRAKTSQVVKSWQDQHLTPKTQHDWLYAGTVVK